MRSAIVRGQLFHRRSDRFARRHFRYPVYLAAIDLDELPALDRELRLFSHGRRNVFALYDRDYRFAAGDLASAVRARFAEAGVAAPASITLITNLRVCGYVFNPVSFFLGYDAAGEITAVLADVNNTYGGNLPYVLGPAQRRAGAMAQFRHTRELFVSPFLHGPACYDFAFDVPRDGGSVDVRMDVHAGDHAEGERIFVARLFGERAPLTDGELAKVAVRYPLMTVQVIALIHYQALWLHLRRVPYRRPGPDHRPLREL